MVLNPSHFVLLRFEHVKYLLDVELYCEGWTPHVVNDHVHEKPIIFQLPLDLHHALVHDLLERYAFVLDFLIQFADCLVRVVMYVSVAVVIWKLLLYTLLNLFGFVLYIQLCVL